jgi:ubiquinone/menaquinone biosynthesis C-methylase UbiE
MDFNLIAPWYDRLSRLVFGDLIYKSQCWFLSEITSKSNVLILGGGTGEVLEKLSSLDLQLTVTYLEASEQMIKIAEKRRREGLTVHFVHGTLTDLAPGTYSFILAPFFFDCFTTGQLEDVMSTLKRYVCSDTVLIFTDFTGTKKQTHRLLIRTMYLFFRVVSGLKVNFIPDYDACFTKHGFSQIQTKSWENGLIESRVYYLTKGLGTLS